MMNNTPMNQSSSCELVKKHPSALFCPCILFGIVEYKRKRLQSHDICKSTGFSILECMKIGALASICWPCSPCFACYVDNTINPYNEFYNQSEKPQYPICFWPIQLDEYYHFLIKDENKTFLHLESSQSLTTIPPTPQRVETKIFVFGYHNSGKSTLIKKLIARDDLLYTFKEYYEPDNDIKIDVKIISFTDNSILLVEVWDVPYERSSSLFLNTFLPQVNSFILLFDPTDLTYASFKKAKHLYELMSEDKTIFTKEKKVYLIATKMDIVNYEQQLIDINTLLSTNATLKEDMILTPKKIITDKATTTTTSNNTANTTASNTNSYMHINKTSSTSPTVLSPTSSIKISNTNQDTHGNKLSNYLSSMSPTATNSPRKMNIASDVTPRKGRSNTMTSWNADSSSGSTVLPTESIDKYDDTQITNKIQTSPKSNIDTSPDRKIRATMTSWNANLTTEPNDEKIESNSMSTSPDIGSTIDTKKSTPPPPLNMSPYIKPPTMSPATPDDTTSGTTTRDTRQNSSVSMCSSTSTSTSTILTPLELAHMWCKENNIPLYEISVKENMNIDVIKSVLFK